MAEGGDQGGRQGLEHADVREHAAAHESQVAEELPADRKTREEDDGENEDLGRTASAQVDTEMETSKPSTQGSLLCLYTRNLDPLTAVAYEMSILPRTQIGLLGAVFASSMSVGLELGSLCSNGSSISYRNMFDGEILAVLILRNDNHGSSEVASDEQDFLFQLIEKAITLVVGADNVYSMCNNVNQFRRSIRTSTVLLQQILQHRHNLIFMTRSIPVNTALLSATRDEMDTRMDSLCNLLGSSHVCFLDKDAMIFATPMWMALDEKTRVLLHLFFMAMDPAKDELNIFIEVNVACKLSVLRCEGSSKVVCYLSRGDSQRDTERLESCTADLVKFLEEEGETLRFKLNGCGIMTVNSSSNLLKLLFVRRDVGLCWIFLPEKAGSLSSQSAGEGWEQQFAVLVHEARTQYLEIHEAKLKQEDLSLFIRQDGYLLLAEWMPGESIEIFSFHEDLQGVDHERECRLTAKKHSRSFVSWAMANCYV